MSKQKCRGAGLGLRPPHLHEVIKQRPAVPWFEVHICNFLGGGLNRALLHQVRAHYPLSFHGVNLNLGGDDPLDQNYLKKLKQAVDELQPALISEHACFTAHQGHFFHDLMPIPYTEEAVKRMVHRIGIVQDLLERKILIENVSRYFAYQESELSESQFLSAVCNEADCGLLLDINNAYVNQHNLNENLDEFINQLPSDRIGEIHLAGYSKRNGWLVDTHSDMVSDAVWQHYARFCVSNPEIPCLIEWDSKLPTFSLLMQQQTKAQQIIEQAIAA